MGTGFTAFPPGGVMALWTRMVGVSSPLFHQSFKSDLSIRTSSFPFFPVHLSFSAYYAIVAWGISCLCGKTGLWVVAGQLLAVNIWKPCSCAVSRASDTHTDTHFILLSRVRDENSHTLDRPSNCAPNHERALTTAPVRNLNVAIFHDG